MYFDWLLLRLFVKETLEQNVKENSCWIIQIRLDIVACRRSALPSCTHHNVPFDFLVVGAQPQTLSGTSGLFLRFSSFQLLSRPARTSLHALTYSLSIVMGKSKKTSFKLNKVESKAMKKLLALLKPIDKGVKMIALVGTLRAYNRTHAQHVRVHTCTAATIGKLSMAEGTFAPSLWFPQTQPPHMYRRSHQRGLCGISCGETAGVTNDNGRTRISR